MNRKQSLPLINSADAAKSGEELNQFYQGNFIPPEKKSYLTRLKDSRGPYMALEAASGEAHYLLDGASQIATLGLGFNAAPFFGVAHHPEVWSNETKSEKALLATAALKSFFERKTGWESVHLALAHSGAEANEIALGEAFEKRAHKEASRVLAFEGSFHGRMMITLSSTWNKSKREPFEWPGFETIYTPFPADPKGEVVTEMPRDWCSYWAGALALAAPKEYWRAEIAQTPLIERELTALESIRTLFAQGDFFALIVEPMQCEGGDRFGTSRFFNALALLARQYQVALIFDEVQTGFHLGRDFFWHKTFDLKDHHDRPLLPDFVTCAKKAQMGMVLSPRPISLYEHPHNTQEFQLAGLLRGLTHALMLDQQEERILTLEDIARSELTKLIKRFSAHLENPRAFGISFAIDLKDKALLGKLIEKRFEVGLLYYPAGENTLRFRLNTAFKKEDVKNLFSHLTLLFAHLFEGAPLEAPTHFETDIKASDLHYQLCELLLNCQDRALSEADFKKRISTIFSLDSDINVVEFNSANYQTYRTKIEALEKEVYEPARQTDISHFERAVKNKNSLCFALEKGGELIAIIFAAPLAEFPLERGLRLDPHFTDPDSLYMLDCTVSPSAQGRGFGLMLKALLTGMATLRGRSRLQGRNRDRLAASMLAINLELGAIEQHFIREDYPDFENHRDVLYYTIDLTRPRPTLALSEGEARPTAKIDKASLLPVIVNKVCLSNFVSQSFLRDVRTLADFLPSGLRHLYTTSGQSEAADKVAKTLWYTRDKERVKTARFLTFKDHYFGAGSFLSRGLSQIGESLFSVDIIEHPEELAAKLQEHSYLALYLEAQGLQSGHRFEVETLKTIIKTCHAQGVKVVLNESASFGHQYDPDHFFASSHPELNIDAGMCYFGSQAGLVFCREENFIAAPLMMISTWDGDELSFALAARNATQLASERAQRPEMATRFEAKLKEQLAPYNLNIQLKNGFGTLTGNLPLAWQAAFRRARAEKTWIVAPSFEMMKHFCKG